MSSIYRVNPDRSYPCVQVESDGDLYIEMSHDLAEDVHLRLSTNAKLGLAADLIQAARDEIALASIARAPGGLNAPGVDKLDQAAQQVASVAAKDRK